MMTNWKKICVLGAALLGSFMPLSAQEVDVDDLLQSMREMTVSQGNRDVMGSIRKGRNKVPFSISARGETLVFQYKFQSQ